MPRIDPIQLLNCLSVLLSPNGGIKSRNEVQRLADLMSKFSKKLVSKCTYIQILKCTETDLLGLFMASGGWLLVHMWLTESIVAKNWPLVKELLELLLLCPVDIERLKTNNCPKLVKELSKDDNHFAIRALASKLVEQWLKTVKGEHVVPVQKSDIVQILACAQAEIKSEVDVKSVEQTEKGTLNEIDIKKEPEDVNLKPDISEAYINISSSSVKNELKENNEKEGDQDSLPVLKISLKDGKQVLTQVEDTDKEEMSDVEKSKDKQKSKSNKDKSSDKSSSSSKSSTSKHKSHSSSEKHKSSHRSSSSSSRHKSKDNKDKEKHSSHSSKSKNDSSSRKLSDKSSSSSSNKTREDRNSKSSEKSRNKEKDTEKTQEKEKSQDKIKVEKADKSKDAQKTIHDKTEEKMQSPSIHKLGKIPKLPELKKEKPSISIVVRKPDDPKPKTVKTFNSKFRTHGLEEEVKPPPSRAAILNKKITPVLPTTVSIPKRPSPVHNETPPEKKPKLIEPIDKPGAIKLIPPKPKRGIAFPGSMLVTTTVYNSLGSNFFGAMLLLESDMFMDALNASATNKKEPKKRKRRTSGSKDGNTPNDGSPPNTPTITSPNSENKSVPPRFYQDTLDTEDNKEKLSEQSPDNKDNMDTTILSEKEAEVSMDTSEPHTLTINGLKGVLCYHKRKGPKKSIRWKPDSELEEVQYFELDETERVNVTKTFTDMKHLERINERDAFQKARNLSNDDIMEERTSWRPLISFDADGQIQVEHGKSSKEKDIQAIRQKGTLQPLYFHKAMIPDSPIEPDVETHTYSEPTIIPLEDITGNQDNISDFRNMPWPEPKGNAPPASNNVIMPNIFPPNIPQFPNGFPNTQFPGVAPFQGPNMVPADWQNGMPPHLMNNGLPGPMGPATLAPGGLPPNIPPGIMIPSENMMMGPDMFGGPNPMFPVPPEGFNMQQNMFPMDFNMTGPQGPPGPEGFPGPGNFRGTMRGGRGAGGHWRGKAGGNWEGGPQRGRGGHSRGGRKAVCIYFQRKGSCRQGDNCSFLHPGVNCPF